MQIKVRVDLPGVGTNLQDRYEVAVVSEVKKDFVLLENLAMGEPAPGQEPDVALKEWREHRTGLYTSNAVIVGILKKSSPKLPAPDLFIFAVPGSSMVTTKVTLRIELTPILQRNTTS